MERHEITAKLKALRNNVASWLKFSQAVFDHQSVQDLFLRYTLLQNALRSEYPSLFDDLPFRTQQVERVGDVPRVERLYINRRSLELLLHDCNYCLDILSNIGIAVDVPAMKVTREGVFFAGQYFDALQRVTEILSQAQQSIVMIDGYIDDKVLNLLTSKKSGVDIKILTYQTAVTPALKTAANAFNQQYGNLSIRTSKAFHDRFVIVDDRDFYHFGASIKDVGHRGFMFSHLEEPEVMNALRKKFAQEWSAATVEV